jgi:site-specific recombinase XerD
MDRTWERASVNVLGRKISPLYEGTRHTVATLALNAGTEQCVVQKFLGHSDPRTTERYAELGDSALVTALKPSSDRLRRK